MAAYCTVTDVLQAAGKFQALTPEETTRVSTAITQAQQVVEKLTGTFFDQRHLQVTTEAVQLRQQKLFMPAPIISVDGNAILEAGVSLVVGTDCLLYQPSLNGIPTGPAWFERNANSFGGSDWSYGGARVFWSTLQQAVVVAGIFGYAVVPLDITKVTAWKAAQLLGMVTIDFTDSGGVTQAVNKNGMPDWATSILRARQVSYFDEQPMMISVLP